MTSQVSQVSNVAVQRSNALQALGADLLAPDDTLAVLVEAAAIALDVPVAFVGLTDGESLWIKASMGMPSAASPLPWDMDICDVLNRGFCVVPDTLQNAAWSNHSWVVGPLATRFMVASALMNSDGVAVGVLCVMGPTPRTLADRDGRILGAMAAVAMKQLELDGSARQQAWQRQLLEQTHGWVLESSSQDSLTQVANRRALMSFLDKSQALARRERQPLSVLLLDVSNFRRINEELGDAVGDQVLTEVAARLVACARGSELVGRMSGDEFMAVLYPCTPEQAQLAGDRYAAAVECEAIFAGGSVSAVPLRLSMSVGHCSLTESESESPDELYRRAALALDTAKAQKA